MSFLEKTLKPIKKALKPPRAKSRTEVISTTEECPEVNVNLTPVEAAEPVTEAVLKETRYASSSESINVKKCLLSYVKC